MSKINRVVTRHGIIVDMKDAAEPLDLSYYDDFAPQDAPHRLEVYETVTDDIVTVLREHGLMDAATLSQLVQSHARLRNFAARIYFNEFDSPQDAANAAAETLNAARL